MGEFDLDKCDVSEGGITGNEDVLRLYRIVNRLLFLLEERLEGSPPFDGIEDVFGSRENVISVITKLTQILMKITPLLYEEDAGDASFPILEDDQKIVERFIERHKFS